MKNNRGKNRVIFDYLSNNREMVIQFDKKQLINSWNQKKKTTTTKPIKKNQVSNIFRKYRILILDNISLRRKISDC